MRRWWLRLARYALPQVRGLLLILMLTLVGVGLGLLGPWPLKLIVDHVLAGHPLPTAVAWVGVLPGAASPNGLLAWLAGATVVLFLSGRLVTIVQGYLKAGVGNRIVYHLASDLFSQLQRCSLGFHRKQRVGDLVRRVTADTACVRQLVFGVYLRAVTSVFTVGSIFIITWQLNRSIALFAVALILPLGLVARRFARPMSERKYREWEVQGEIAALAEQTLTTIPVVQAFGREEWEDSRFRQLARKTVQATLRSEILQHQFQVSTGTISAVGRAIVLVVGGISVLQGNLSVGSLLVLISYFAALSSHIETMAYLSEDFASASAGARRVMQMLVPDDQAVTDLPGAKPHPEVGQAGVCVRMEGVTFGYEADRPVLHDISLVARPGEIIALVGSTGAGKSTLVSLIPRFFDPWQGAVYFNDLDIRRCQLSSVRKQIAIVTQEPFLLPMTIAQNIGYSRPEADRQEIVAAAVAANADPFIQQLPHGYDTVIGERGVTLSGGQRQRLSIARALLRNAPILILDEPTSALDALTEAALVEALERLMAGRTTFIIAHRLSTIRRANQIVVMEHGRCVEQGVHDELVSLRGHYYRFHESQTQAPETLAEASTVQEGV